MAIPKQPSITFLLLALVILSFTPSSNADDCSGRGGTGAISVYWGQRSENEEGTLESLCSTGNYKIVILESLYVYDDDRTPSLNLAGHCVPSCSKLQPEIEYCQKNNIKVLLSIGQDIKTLKTNNPHSLSNPKAAEKLATYLLENYLSGKPGPLGNVSLDGIDIAEVEDGTNLKWDEVVTAINASTTARKIYLSASPQCVDFNLGAAIRTGLFDYIWVEFFYQNPCNYANGDATNLLKEWDQWTKKAPKSKIFLGLVAMYTKDIAGYVPPEDLISKVLPTAKNASNYGGVMLWDRSFDIKSNYSGQIKDSVPKGSSCRCVCDDDNAAFGSNSFYGLGSASLRLSV